MNGGTLKLLAFVIAVDAALAAGAGPLEAYSLRVAGDSSSSAPLIVLLLLANLALLALTVLAFRASLALLARIPQAWRRRNR